MRRLLLACVALLAGCGAQVESDPEPCELADTLIEKRWFAGELDTEDDDPVFVMRIAIVAIESDAPTAPVFADAETERQVRFLITQNMLFARTADDDPVALAGFPIPHHRSAKCPDPPNPNPDPFVGMPPPGTQHWYLRPLFRVDWSRNLMVDGHRFDAAAAAGHPDAATYEPVIFPPGLEPEPELEMDDGYLAVTVGMHIRWQDIDDDTPGCVYDFPDLPPGAECPDVLLKLRYEFRPVGAPP